MKKRKILVTCVAILLVTMLAFTLVGCDGSGDKVTPGGKEVKLTNAFITVDINPSLEILTGADGKVTTVTALNKDAELLIVDLKLVGLTVDEAMAKILAEAKATGFLLGDGKDEVLVSAEGDAKKEEIEAVLSDSVKKFADASKANINLLKADATSDPKLAAEAEKNGVTIAKMKLINLYMSYNKKAIIDEVKKMPVRKLNEAITKERTREAEFVSQDLKLKYEQAKQMIEAREDIEAFKVFKDIIAKLTGDDLKDNLGTMTLADFQAKLNAMNDGIQTINAESLLKADKFALKAEEIAKITTLANEVKTAEAELKTLMNADKKDADAIKAAKRAISDKYEALDECIDTIEDAYEEGKEAQGGQEEVVGQEIDIEVEIGAEIEITAVVDVGDLVELEMEKIFTPFIEEFEAAGVNGDAIEELYEEEIETAMEAYEDGLDLQIDKIKDQFKADIAAVKGALQAEKDALKALMVE